LRRQKQLLFGCIAALAASVASAADPDVSSWRGFNLIGMLRAPWDTSDKRATGRFDERHFEWIKEWGFNFVRLPMDYRHFMSTNDWSCVREDGMSKVDEAVRFGLKHGLHVQLCLHRAPGFTILSWDPEPRKLQTDTIAQKAFADLWRAFAKRYRDVPSERLSFNLVNEPCGFTEEQYVKVFGLALKAIREEDPDRFVMLDGNWTASRPVAAFYSEPHTGQAFRGYTPHAISHYKAWYIKEQPEVEPTWPLSETMAKRKTWIYEMPEATLAKFASARAHGYPVMIGEFGCYNRLSHATCLAWMEDCLKLWKRNGLAWAIWNLNGPFGILDSERSDVAYEDFHGHKLDRKMLDLLIKYQ